MKNVVWAMAMLVILFLHCGCNKEDGISCFKSTGPITQEDRSVGPYHYIEVHNNVNLFLTQDSSKNELVVEAGENLLPGITTINENGRLVIRNENKCNWLRDFSVPINVYLTFSSLDTIVYRTAGDLICMNTWARDSIRFEVWEGAGEIRLDLNTQKSQIYVHYGTASIQVAGFSQVTFIANLGYGPINTLDLFSKFTYLSTRSPNDCYVFASEDLEVEITNIGNVYYSGDPKQILTKISGEGKLIKLP